MARKKRSRRTPLSSVLPFFQYVSSFSRKTHLTILLFIIISAFRILSPSLPSNRPELVSPLTSSHTISNGLTFSTLSEAVRVSHHSPLTIKFYSLVFSFIGIRTFNVLCDLSSSYLLYSLSLLTTTFESPSVNLSKKMDARILPPSLKISPYLPPLLYYLSPITIAVGLTPSLQPLTHFLLLLSYHSALRGSAPLSILTLSLNSTLSIWPLYQIIPTLNLLYFTSPSVPSLPRYLSPLLLLLLFSLFLPLLPSHYLNLKSLTPTPSIHWYFLQMVFPRYLSFYRVIFLLLPLVLTFPVTLRLHPLPHIGYLCCLGIVSTMHPYPTYLTFSFILTTLLTSGGATISRLRLVGFVSLVCLPLPLVLFSKFYTLWVSNFGHGMGGGEPGGGNGNYVYFQQLVFAIFYSLVVLDFLSAGVTRLKALRVTIRKNDKVKDSQLGYGLVLSSS